MALPVNVPCIPCGGDRLHVWDRSLKSWKCNDCGNIKRSVPKRPIDEFMRRRRRCAKGKDASGAPDEPSG
jgi:hypothetical protein